MEKAGQLSSFKAPSPELSDHLASAEADGKDVEDVVGTNLRAFADQWAESEPMQPWNNRPDAGPAAHAQALSELKIFGRYEKLFEAALGLGQRGDVLTS